MVLGEDDVHGMEIAGVHSGRECRLRRIRRSHAVDVVARIVAAAQVTHIRERTPCAVHNFGKQGLRIVGVVTVVRTRLRRHIVAARQDPVARTIIIVVTNT